MRTRIKICGVKTPDIARHAALCGADAVGLVFVDKSPRFVTRDEAQAVVSALPAFVDAVGLFADAAPEEIFTYAREINLRSVQLHGSEPPEMLQQLREFRVTKALPFDGAQVTGLEEWLRAAPPNLAGIIIDAPPAKGLTGGTGHALDWKALRAALDGAEKRFGPLPPVILAGGLTPQNVAQAVAFVRPYAVDVSSGVEESRGVKSKEKIAAFCLAAAQAVTSRA